MFTVIQVNLVLNTSERIKNMFNPNSAFRCGVNGRCHFCLHEAEEVDIILIYIAVQSYWV